MRAAKHWNEVYSTKQSTGVSWYQPSPIPSLEVLDRFASGNELGLIDVGGGASNLADALLTRGWSDITVLDIASPALKVAQDRLGDKANRVKWHVADVTYWQPTRAYDVWHDRAVFHFLLTLLERRRYVELASRTVRSGGWIVISTFALTGPSACSGLSVCQYNAKMLAAEFGVSFQLVREVAETHVTPAGKTQAFIYVVFRRK